jgi:hypothetical protein
MSVVALAALRRAAAPARAAAPRLTLAPRRQMGAGGGRPWADKQSPYYGHFKPQPVHEVLGTIYATTMWVWMMYRAEKDWQWVLGFKHPWDCH